VFRIRRGIRSLNIAVAAAKKLKTCTHEKSTLRPVPGAARQSFGVPLPPAAAGATVRRHRLPNPPSSRAVLRSWHGLHSGCQLLLSQNRSSRPGAERCDRLPLLLRTVLCARTHGRADASSSTLPLPGARLCCTRARGCSRAWRLRTAVSDWCTWCSVGLAVFAGRICRLYSVRWRSERFVNHFRIPWPLKAWEYASNYRTVPCCNRRSVNVGLV
jgi:hypothetical protein